jgi:hypothetical protein
MSTFNDAHGYATFIKRRLNPHRIYMRRPHNYCQTFEAFLDGQQYPLAGSGGDVAFAGHLLSVQSTPQTN